MNHYKIIFILNVFVVWSCTSQIININVRNISWDVPRWPNNGSESLMIEITYMICIYKGEIILLYTDSMCNTSVMWYFDINTHKCIISVLWHNNPMYMYIIYSLQIWFPTQSTIKAAKGNNAAIATSSIDNMSNISLPHFPELHLSFYCHWKWHSGTE